MKERMSAKEVGHSEPETPLLNIARHRVTLLPAIHEDTGKRAPSPSHATTVAEGSISSATRVALRYREFH